MALVDWLFSNDAAFTYPITPCALCSVTLLPLTALNSLRHEQAASVNGHCGHRQQRNPLCCRVPLQRKPK